MPLVNYPKTKTSNDIQIYFNPYIGRVTHNVMHDGNNHIATPVQCCVDPALEESCTCPVNSFEATVIQKKNQGAVGPLTAFSPLYAATRGRINPIAEADFVSWVCLPPPDYDTLICFDQGASVSPGVSHRPIPLKYNPVDHYVRQRPENTLTLNDLFVSNWDGLQRIRGIPCTIIIKVAVEGSSLYSEIQYYSNVLLSPSQMNSGSDGNASIDISMDGPFSFCAIFAGPDANWP
jgi:hypothetical protein